MKEISRLCVLHYGFAIYPKGYRDGFRGGKLLPGPAGQQPIFRMKILLRNKATGFFYAGGNQWTQDVDAAHDFETGLNALQYSSKTQSANVEFVYLDSDVPDGFVLPKVAVYQRQRV